MTHCFLLLLLKLACGLVFLQVRVTLHFGFVKTVEDRVNFVFNSKFLDLKRGTEMQPSLDGR